MENFKFILISIIILILILFAGYWAFNNIETGNKHVDKQELKRLEKENLFLKNEIESLESRLEKLSNSALKDQINDNGSSNEETKEDIQEEKIDNLKHQALINELQKLINEKIFMKKGSKGTRVGVVQNFLNIYNNTNKKIDNDFGITMENDIKNFQKAQGLVSDGEAGPDTFQKMITWLKN